MGCDNVDHKPYEPAEARDPALRAARSGSLRDVQILAGHAALSTTQRYIEADVEAQRKVVDLI
jgi:hypothetical protein